MNTVDNGEENKRCFFFGFFFGFFLGGVLSIVTSPLHNNNDKTYLYSAEFQRGYSQALYTHIFADKTLTIERTLS